MNKLILDGVEYCLSDSLVAKLKEEIAINDAVQKRRNPFERFDNEDYYYIDECGELVKSREAGDYVDNKIYAVANYCRDEELMNQRALHETLNRLLWRYSETHGGDPRWMLGDYPANVYHYEIVFAPASKVFRVVSAINAKTGGIYFKDAATAQAAIEEVVNPFLAKHPAFVW